MKEKILKGVAALLVTVALGLGARQIYSSGQMAGCMKISIASIEAVFGKIPEQYKPQILPGLEAQCRQVL